MIKDNSLLRSVHAPSMVEAGVRELMTPAATDRQTAINVYEAMSREAIADYSIIDQAADLIPDGVSMNGRQVKEFVRSIGAVLRGEADSVTIGANGHSGVEVKLSWKES